MEEIWKDIVGYEGLYEVSNLGSVRSADQRTTYKPRLNKGHLRIDLMDHNDIRKSKFVHRLVAEAFIPNPAKYPQVNHLNGIKTDNRVENLEWTTASGNLIHAIENGLRPIYRGENVTGSKLTVDDVILMRRMYNEGWWLITELASLFGVSTSQVRKVCSGQKWAHIREGLVIPHATPEVDSKRKYVDREPKKRDNLSIRDCRPDRK